MAQGYTFEPMPQRPQVVHAMTMQPQSNFKEVMTLEAVPYPQYDQTVYHQQLTYTSSRPTSPLPSPIMTREQNKVQRSAPPPPRALSSEEDEDDEHDIPVFNKKKKKAQRSAQRAPAPMPQTEALPEIIIVDHEEPKYRVVQIENEVLAPRRERVEAETISVNERLIDVERVHLTEEAIDVEKIVVKEVQVPFDVYVTFCLGVDAL